MDCPDKSTVIAALLERLEAETQTMIKAANSAREAATHEEAKPENDKDTRALEASYLAAGQAERVRELQAAAKAIRALPTRDLPESAPVQAGALVTLEDDGGVESLFFMAPSGGGTTLELGDVRVQVVTPLSPLGKALLGHGVGEAVELRGKAGKVHEMAIVGVR